MKTYKVLLIDSVTNEVAEVLENFKPDLSNSDFPIKDHLYDLQLSYCEGSELPEITRTVIKSDGSLFNVIMATSEADYFHMIVLGEANIIEMKRTK